MTRVRPRILEFLGGRVSEFPARCISSLTSEHPSNWPCHRTREEGRRRWCAKRENSTGRSLLLAPWSSLYQWMLVWRRRHASLSFQRAVTPTRLTRTKRRATYTRSAARHSLVTSLETTLETVRPLEPRFPATLLCAPALLFFLLLLIPIHTYIFARARAHTYSDSPIDSCVTCGCNKTTCVCVCVCVHTRRSASCTPTDAHKRQHPFAFLHPRAPQPNSP